MRSQEPRTDDLLEPERYELHEPIAHEFEVNRREFVQLLGAGLLFSAAGGISHAQRSRRNRSGGGTLAQRLHVGRCVVTLRLTGNLVQETRGQIFGIFHQLRRLFAGDTRFEPFADLRESRLVDHELSGQVHELVETVDIDTERFVWS